MNKAFGFTMSSLAVLISAQAMAGGLIRDRRCDTWGDTLDGGQAKDRVDWALKCETERSVVRDIKMNFTNGVADSNGTKSVGYPTYGRYNEASSIYENPASWFAPPQRANPADPNSPALPTSSGCNIRPAGYEVAYYCAAGCMTPEQKILTSQGEVAYEEALDQEVPEVQTLSADSTLENLNYHSSSVDQFVTDIQPGHQKILNFATQSGGALRVTENHPLVNREGKVVMASQIQVGDDLVKENGELDPVISIVPEDYFGKVYNVKISSPDLKDNIVVAQGYLNGSVRYQNEFVKDLNRELLRTVVANQLMK